MKLFVGDGISRNKGKQQNRPTVIDKQTTIVKERCRLVYIRATAIERERERKRESEKERAKRGERKGASEKERAKKRER